MQVKFGFTLLSPNEFVGWINNTRCSRRIRTIQLHHTYLPDYNTFYTTDKKNHFVRQLNMQQYHKRRGFADIAQHFTIFPDGKICTGRSLNSHPAGIKGCNTNAICIECVGNFDNGHDEMTDAQQNAIIVCVRALLDRFRLDAKKNITYHAWWTAGGVSLGTYRPSKSCKTCPGTNFFGGNTREAFEENLLPYLLGDDEVVEKAKVLIDGKEVTVERILKNDTNYIRLRDFDEILGLCKVGYDAKKKLPTITKEC